MKDIRTADDLQGLWAAVPMVWTPTGELDETRFARNIDRLAAVPCDGVYSTDADGEFYAIELDEFRRFVGVFTRCMQPHNCGIQVGVTWTNTQGVIDRIRVCLDHGISTVHVCYPYFMPLNGRDVKRFWEDLAHAAPEARWVHYYTPRGHVRMNAVDYQWMAEQFPDQFIGTKLGAQDFLHLSEIIGSTPNVAHFAVDYTVVPVMLLGGRGTYSFWVTTLPRWHRQFVNLCLNRRWDDAAVMQSKMNQWEVRHLAPLVAEGYLHGIAGKARATATGFLDDLGYTRAPYQPVPTERIEKLASAFRADWAKELALEQLNERA